LPLFNTTIFNVDIFAEGNPNNLDKVYNAGGFNDAIFNTVIPSVGSGRGGISKLFNVGYNSGTGFNDSVVELTTDVGLIFNRNIFSRTMFNGRGDNIIAVIKYKLTGITYSGVGTSSILGSVVCRLHKDNLDNTSTFIEEVNSNSVTGVYAFLNLPDNDSQYYITGWHYGATKQYDMTDHDLTPEIQ
jgi:hypothetical protein